MNTQTQEALKELQEAQAQLNDIIGIVGEYIYVSGQQNMNSHLSIKHINLCKAIDNLLECLK